MIAVVIINNQSRAVDWEGTRVSGPRPQEQRVHGEVYFLSDMIEHGGRGPCEILLPRASANLWTTLKQGIKFVQIIAAQCEK